MRPWRPLNAKNLDIRARKPGKLQPTPRHHGLLWVAWINFSKGRSHGKHQNLVARGGRGHLGGGGSSTPGYRRRYVGAAAAGGGRGDGYAPLRAAGKPSRRDTGFFRVGRRQRRGRGQYQRS